MIDANALWFKLGAPAARAPAAHRGRGNGAVNPLAAMLRGRPDGVKAEGTIRVSCHLPAVPGRVARGVRSPAYEYRQ